MRQYLLICCIAILFQSTLTRPAQAQSIAAGQTTGVIYVDISPDKTISSTDSLDLDGDNRYDLRLSVSVASSFPSSSASYCMPMHDDVNISSLMFGPIITGFSSNATIQQQVPSGQQWGSRASLYPGLQILTWRGSNPAGQQSYGNWFWGDAYLAVRLRSSANSPWSYGWVRIQVVSPTTPAIVIKVKDYALTNTVLAQTAAQEAGWQIYPTPTTDWITVRAPEATVAHITVNDACGRALIVAVISSTNAEQRLDLSPLSAGIYVLHIKTSNGTLNQRIVKR